MRGLTLDLMFAKSMASDLPLSRSRFELATDNKWATSASYPKDMMFAIGRSTGKSAFGQHTPLECVHAFSRLPVKPCTKTMLSYPLVLEGSMNFLVVPYSTIALAGIAKVAIPIPFGSPTSSDGALSSLLAAEP
jgi:hypothetical protein